MKSENFKGKIIVLGEMQTQGSVDFKNAVIFIINVCLFHNNKVGRITKF